MNKVLVTDIAWKSMRIEGEILAQVGAEPVLCSTGSEAEQLELVTDAVAILTNWLKVPASVVRAGKNLQVIGRYGIGVDNIAVDEATRLGIPVTNVPTYCLDEVAEHALALLLSLARRVTAYNAEVHHGVWVPLGAAPLFRVSGKTLGLIGFGKIAQTLAAKAHGLGLACMVYDPYVPAERAAALGCRKVELDDLLARADFVSIHTPLTAQTRGLLSAEKLARLKPTAFLINTSRGAVVDEAALVDALQRGAIAGAALDVLASEPIPAGHPLLSLPNVILTPHVSFYSEESLATLQVEAAQNVAAVLAGRKPAHVVNPQVLALPRWSGLA